MKKLSVLLVAAVVALGASAGVNFKATHAVKSNKVINTEMTKVNPKSFKEKAQMRVITTQPEGELKSYSRTGDCVYVSSGNIYAGSQDSFRSDIVYAEDGVVYIKNILAGCGAQYGDSWVEGYIEGNEIHVPLGQSIYWSDYYGADVVLAMGTTYVEGTSLYFDVDDRADEAVYIIEGETITLQGTYADPTGSDYPAYEGYGLSCYWTDDDSFGGFNEWNTVLTEREPVVTPTVITEIPEGCQVYQYYRNSGYIANSWFGIYNGETDGKINVAFDMTNGDVYIQNPSWWHDSYESWVKGTYDWMTGIITIPTGQYLSWSDAYEYGVVLGWGSTYVYTEGDEDGDGEDDYYMGYEIDDRTTEIQLMIDDDCLWLMGTEGDIYAEFPDNYNATGMLTYWSDDLSMTAIEFCNRDEYGYAEPWGKLVNVAPAVPADPTADEWYDCGDESGFSKFYFTLPETDVDGNPIDPEYLSYIIWINDGNGSVYQFTFPAEDYTFDLEEDIDEVYYWLYSSAVDFHDYYIYMYRTNEEGYEPLFVRDEDHDGNIGIQVFYTVNGERNASNIAWLYDVQSSVNEMNAGKTVANVRFFNVAGQEIAQPEGLTIKVTTYTDGTTSAVKVVK